MVVRLTRIDPSYWRNNEGALENGVLFQQNVTVFLIDPVAVDTLEGTKTSTFTTSEVNTNFKKLFSNNINIPNASNFTLESFTENGWSGTVPALVQELATFLKNNVGNSSEINVGNNDINLVLAFGNINGTDYVIPFGYIGNVGETIGDDIYGDMLFTDMSYDFTYGNALFTDTEFDLIIDGGDFNG